MSGDNGNGKGGYREGAGRPRGSMRTAVMRVVEGLGDIARDTSVPVEQRLAAAETAARLAQARVGEGGELMIEIQVYSGLRGDTVAEARHAGLLYSAERRDGALPELVRRLVAAGASGPWRTVGGSFRASGQSLVGWPDCRKPMRRRRWRWCTSPGATRNLLTYEGLTNG